MLIRHGEADCNVRQVVGGERGCTGLSPEGKDQVRSLTGRLNATGELAGATVLYSSVLRRAVQTAELISAVLGGLDVIQDCDLCEIHPGECDGMAWEELEVSFGNPDFSTHPERQLSPGGESWSEFMIRVKSALSDLVARHPGQTVVVASHGGVIDGSLVNFAGKQGFGSGLGFGPQNTSITEWAHCQDRWRLLRYNDAAHLYGAWSAEPVPDRRAPGV
ncbi:MAG: histidine phosphatase family protein [Acidimicrobiales bacterium]